jgi:hypothetical protein
MFLTDLDLSRIEWTELAACGVAGIDVNDYFPTPGHAPSPEALAACAQCPVRRECLAWAYERRLAHGWFAGVAPTLRAAYTEGDLWALLLEREAGEA